LFKPSTIRLRRISPTNLTPVKRLEILVGSTSLARTMSILYFLGTLGLVDTGLIFLWALSPLAGQTSLRVLETKNITDTPAIGFLWRAVNPGFFSNATSSRFPYAQSNYIAYMYIGQTQLNGGYDTSVPPTDGDQK